MPSESIIWTALPHGVTGTGSNRRLLISISASPRLSADSGDNSLAEFAEFAHWTQRVVDSVIRFELRWRNPAEQTGSAGTLATQAQVLSPAVWDQMIWQTAAVVVRPRSVGVVEPDPVATYPAGPGYAAIRQSYQNAAVTAITGQPPSPVIDEMLTVLRLLHDAPSRVDAAEWTTLSGRRYRVHSPTAALQFANDRAYERRRNALDSEGEAGDGPVRISPFERIDSVFATDSDDPALAVGHMLAWHQQAILASQAAAVGATDAPGTPEFHELITAITGFPSVGRRLGLIFELELPVTQLGFSGPGFIQVLPQWNPALTAVPITPWTALDARTGWPISSPRARSKVDRGFLLSSPSGNGRLDAVPIDLASATLKLDVMSAGSSADRRLPALRSAGFAIVRAGQAAIAHDAQQRAARNDGRVRNDEAITLYAEDINRGYRVDARMSGGGGWRSLHRLDRSFQIGTVSWSAEEEGFTQLSAVQAITPLPDEFPYLLMQETVATWQGWSLSAARPGKSIGANGVLGQPPATFDLGGITVRQKPTGDSLPRLRFGKEYRFRVRTVDLAGNARVLADEPENDAAILPGPDDTLACFRFEPLEPPVLVPRSELGMGETIDRLVVRSSNQLSPRAFARRNRASAPANQRHLIPGKTTQVTAEQHGVFDAAFGSGPGTAEAAVRAYEIAKRESGTLDGTNGNSENVVHLGETDNAASYTIFPEAQVVLPYLPDPLGRGVALRNLPGPSSGRWGRIDAAGALIFELASGLGEGNVTRLPYGAPNDWPDLRPIRVQLEGNATTRNPRWSAADRLLTVFLPPGSEYRIGLRTFVEAGDLESLGVWKWAQEELESRDAAEDAPGSDPIIRERLATAGDYWFITPERSLHLVHAVQQPIESPVLDDAEARRPPAATFAELKNTISIHARTTARIDLSATWTDTVDPVTHAPYPVTRESNVRSQQINDFEGHDDWERRRTSDPIWQQKSTQMLTVYGALENPGYPSAKPVSEEGAALATPPVLEAPVRHEFGDTKHRMVTYTVTAGTRFREYFPASVTSDPANITVTSEPVLVDVPSSVRPLPPRVPYAVPAFRWRTPLTPSLAQQRQRWGGIRIYLDRPWYSSGANERLAVVLWAGPSWPPDPALAPYVTRWGTDPIWSGSGSLMQRPTAASFPLRDPAFDGKIFSLPDLPGVYGASFGVAAHNVTFPEDDDEFSAGRCWCDIQIDPGNNYTPFVRLAVARFQPSSIDDCHLSAVALTDFLQIAAHRSVTLAPQGGSAVSVTISGEATGQAFGPSGLLPANRFDVSLERRIPGYPDEAGWEPTNAVVTPGASGGAGVLWQGTVALPASTGVPRRLAIREYEQLPSDQASLDRRLVFADTILLP